ncbi:MAG: hypothetical protein ACI971_002063, partial [Colwellia sp.]
STSIKIDRQKLTRCSTCIVVDQWIAVFQSIITA